MGEAARIARARPQEYELQRHQRYGEDEECRQHQERTDASHIHNVIRDFRRVGLRLPSIASALPVPVGADALQTTIRTHFIIGPFTDGADVAHG